MAEATVHNASVLVPEAAMTEFRKRLSSLNAKALKYGLPSVVAGEPSRERWARRTRPIEGGTEMYTVPLGNAPGAPDDEIVYIYRIDLDYPIVKLGDYQVLAKIEHLAAGNVLFSATADPADTDLIESYRHTELCCEHCQMKRQRKETFVLRSLETGDLKQVGSSCLEEYTGVDPAAALFLAQMHAFYMESTEPDGWGMAGGFGGGGGGHYTSAKSFLARVVFAVEQHGFVSTTKARENPGAGRATYEVAMDLEGDMRRKPSLAAEWREAHARVHEMADKILTWWGTHEPKGDYETNLKTILVTGDVKWERKYLAVVAGAVPGYQRYIAQTYAKSAQPSEHVGAKGDKFEKPLRFEKRHGFEGYYGTTYRFNFTDVEGNRYSWKTATVPDELSARAQSVGQWFAGRFRVKEHTVYDGAKITDISHVKVLEWVPDPRPGEVIAQEEQWRREAGLVTDGTAETRPFLVARVDRITPGFDATGWREQMGCVLWGGSNDLRYKISDMYAPVELKDADGNVVGSITYSEAEPAPEEGDALQIVLAPNTHQEWSQLLGRAASLIDSVGSRFELKDRNNLRRGFLQWKGIAEYEHRQEFVAKGGKDAHTLEILKKLDGLESREVIETWKRVRVEARKAGLSARPAQFAAGELRVEYLADGKLTAVVSRLRAEDGALCTFSDGADGAFSCSPEEQRAELTRAWQEAIGDLSVNDMDAPNAEI